MGESSGNHESSTSMESDSSRGETLIRINAMNHGLLALLDGISMRYSQTFLEDTSMHN